MPKASTAFWSICSPLIWLSALFLTIVISCLTLLCAVVCWPFDRERRLAHWCSTLWGTSFVSLAPWRVIVTGRQHIHPGKAYVLVANHQSMFDIPVLFCLRRQFKWVSKASLFSIPFLGWAMRASGYIALARGEHGSIRDTYEAARTWLKRGVSVLFFPEATRTRSGAMLPFKNGAFKLALERGVPVVPIAVEGTRRLLDHGWRVRPATIRITILPAIDPARESITTFDQLRDRTQQAIAETLSR